VLTDSATGVTQFEGGSVTFIKKKTWELGYSALHPSCSVRLTSRFLFSRQHSKLPTGNGNSKCLTELS